MTHACAYINAIGIAAPGLPDWSAARTVLRDEQAYAATELPVYQPSLLPPNERRRASPTVRMAFRVAEEATREQNAAGLATVFVSADGDLQISNRICTALAEAQRFISPTDFHNSVHNAAAGYWSIASGAQGPSTAISGWDTGFVVGLLEAWGMVQVEHRDTLLVAYDLPAPEPLFGKRALSAPFGIALLLSGAAQPNSLARFTLEETEAAETAMTNPAMEALRRSNPAARALPLLECIARENWGALHLAQHNGKAVRITLNPVT